MTRLYQTRIAKDRAAMSLDGKAYIVGAFEHPSHFIADVLAAQFHAKAPWGRVTTQG